MTIPADSSAFLDAVEARRSYTAIGNTSPIPDEKLKAIIEHAVKYTPTAFNMQSSRVVLVTGQKHQDLWKMIESTYLAVVGDNEEQIKMTKARVASFLNGYGTILTFEDNAVINGFSGNMPALAKVFPVWAENQAGMLQYVLWAALAKEGLGVSLQHYAAYSAETSAEIAKLLDVPQSWQNTGIMPFGVPTGAPGNPARPKTFQPVEDRVKIIS
ncbi:Nitroreductase-like protein [Papiliotrema laurentii]|uniref:Nitroreductase-like protein n=1 Tax=Papiliotrema laurentii TaxID=5418 RepID=A0AAD9FU43_PAPLA|nr:Nitroreductase-like protein [Papiliotrema laurentii]